MANKLWEAPGIDRRLTAELQHHVRILWVDPPVSFATPAQRRAAVPRTIRPILSTIDDRCIRLTPTALPGLRRYGIRTTTATLVRAQVRWALRRIDVKPVAVVATSLEDVQGHWGSGVVSALHGTDDYVAGAELMGLSKRQLRAQERRAVTRADVVTAVSPLLTERWSALRGSPVQLIPNGCSPAGARKSPLTSAIKNLPRPVIGLVGRLSARIDLDIVEAIADAGYSLLVVGPHDPRWEPQRFSALIARPGVHYVGPVNEEQASTYIAATDIGITPYLHSQFNRASFPLKTLDYLSAGRPVVSTSLPAARWLLDDAVRFDQEAFSKRILSLADGPEAFVRAVRHVVGAPGRPHQLNGDSPGDESPLPYKCQAFAARHSWSSRADALAAAIGLAARGSPTSPQGPIASSPTDYRSSQPCKSLSDHEEPMSFDESMLRIENHASRRTLTNPQSLRQAERVDCAAVIVTYNSERYIVDLLGSLPAAAAGMTLRIVVVDNGSTDATVDLVHSFPDVQCIEAEANLGYAGGINVGRKQAGEYSSLLVLNPDVMLYSGALHEMAAEFRDPTIGIVVPMVLDFQGHCFPSLRNFPTLTRAIGDALLGSRISRRPSWLSEMIWDEASYSSRHSVDWATGAAFLISADCDRAVGSWDERFFLYSEETDYANRARSAGFQIVYLPTARVLHRGGGSSQSSALVALMAVSRVRYMEKHGHRPWAYRMALIIAALLRSSSREQRDALRALLRRSRWPALIASLQNRPLSKVGHTSEEQAANHASELRVAIRQPRDDASPT
jgi:teichuronic acid biosynthesis glycosyltransferase TuaH